MAYPFQFSLNLTYTLGKCLQNNCLEDTYTTIIHWRNNCLYTACVGKKSLKKHRDIKGVIENISSVCENKQQKRIRLDRRQCVTCVENEANVAGTS